MLTAGHTLPLCGELQSINKHLELIIFTRFGEHSSDPTFGCEIWDMDFELIGSENLWSEKLRRSMLRSVVQHEPRLSNIVITITIREVARNTPYAPFIQLKNRVEVSLTAKVNKTGDPFYFNMELYLGPLSVE
ncbi:hypothetical protein EXU57_19570 [Segetibacter sp. 3557_3]|uniref:GPW/gp25 family protein n=1 Tax=Segetibacter sp. 3557_3 TaxID=2547429 RepID=UPI00105907AA|nr:GPW/gp25 family protein [Segetibacter sp. 3557_3]TDH21401.1 hypothetical protein EXU57_19570 [Segetibacter sp. 3557_3]